MGVKISLGKFISTRRKQKFMTQEELANKYAEDSLIPNRQYQEFKEKKHFDLSSICCFADQINRDPGIVLGRLQKDGVIGFEDQSMNSLRHKYKVKTVI